MQAGKFKAKCLNAMETVRKTGKSLIITRRKIPIVRIVPIEQKEPISLFGKMQGSVHEIGDIIKPINEDWNASH